MTPDWPAIRDQYTRRMMSNLDGTMDAEVKRLRTALERVEYASRKDSLCDSERLDNVRKITRAALALPSNEGGAQ